MYVFTYNNLSQVHFLNFPTKNQRSIIKGSCGQIIKNTYYLPDWQVTNKETFKRNLSKSQLTEDNSQGKWRNPTHLRFLKVDPK